MENFITICGRKFELFYSTWVMEKTAEKCGGDIAALGTWLSTGTTTEIISKCVEIIALLINGGIQKRNFEIQCGFIKGTPAPLIDSKAIAGAVNPTDIARYKDAIFSAMAAGSDFVVPEGAAVEAEEKDPDLEEIRAKNAEKNL